MASKKADEPKRVTASDLIAEADKRSARWLPDEWLLGELEKLRDARNRGVPIHADDAVKLLNANGWACGRSKFDKLLMDRYGAKWCSWGRE